VPDVDCPGAAHGLIDTTSNRSGPLASWPSTAVRIGAAGSQNLVARRVGATRVLCCAAPSYLERHGEPREPEDLAKHLCLTYEDLPNRNVWSFRDPKGTTAATLKSLIDAMKHVSRCRQGTGGPRASPISFPGPTYASAS
jgi:hypothetical protein